jgi:foldase protein PrsA
MKKETSKTKAEVKEVKVTIKKLPVVKIAVIVLLGLLAGAYYQFGNVAYVNGKPISRLAYIKTMEKQSGEAILDQMVTEALIMAEAEKQKVVIEQSVIDEEVKAIEEQLSSQGQTLEAVLETEKMTREDLERQITLQKLVDKLAGADVEVTDEQVGTFLKENKDFLPEEATDEELDQLAKEQISSQGRSEAINNWLEKIKSEANIIYK